MEHYFTRKPTSSEEIHHIHTILQGRKLIFESSSGVFSKKRIDFGSRFLVETVRLKNQDKLLDVGCGYGVCGIALSFHCRYAFLIDINLRACYLTKTNIALNGVTNASVVCGSPDCFRSFCDVAVMNPPIRAGKTLVFDLILSTKRCLNPGGRLYLVARTKQGAKSIFVHMEEEFSSVTYASLKGGYRVIEAAV
jgi:16S rRNA (guanine1207-N2)-methyltransferase